MWLSHLDGFQVSKTLLRYIFIANPTVWTVSSNHENHDDYTNKTSFMRAMKSISWATKSFTRAKRSSSGEMKSFSEAMKSFSEAMKYEKSRFRQQWNMNHPVVNWDQHFRSWMHDQIEKVYGIFGGNPFLKSTHIHIDLLVQTIQQCKNHTNALMCQSWIWNGNTMLCWMESIPIIWDFGPLCRTWQIVFLQ